MSSMSILGQALKAELASINELLIPAGVTATVNGAFTAEQLDRVAAEKEAQEEMSLAVSENTTDAIATQARIVHEATRVRRDVKIANASHKQLLLGSYRTLYQRKLQLEQYLKEDTYV